MAPQRGRLDALMLGVVFFLGLLSCAEGRTSPDVSRNLRASSEDAGDTRGDNELQRMESLMRAQALTIQYQQKALAALEAQSERLKERQAVLKTEEVTVDKMLLSTISNVRHPLLLEDGDDDAAPHIKLSDVESLEDFMNYMKQHSYYAIAAFFTFVVLMVWVTIDVTVRNAREAAKMAGQPVPEKWRHCETRSRLGPTLHEDGYVDPVYKVWVNVYYPSCIWALAALGDPGFNGSWKLTDNEAYELLHTIESSDGFTADDDGNLDLKELLRYIEIEENRKHIRTLPAGVRGLLVDDQVKSAVKKFDKNKDGKLDRKEFLAFLDTLAVLHLEHLHKMALVGFRAYWGKGQKYPELHADKGESVKLRDDIKGACGAYLENTPNPIQVGRDPDMFLEGSQSHLFPDGWFSDYWYYLCNNHPLLGIVLCDPVHPLSSVERLMIELSTVILSFTSIYVKRRVEDGDVDSSLSFLEDPMYFRLCVQTLPGVIVWWLLFILFTTPGFGHADLATATKAQIRTKWIIRQTCACLGYLFLAGSLFYFAVEVVNLLSHTGGIFKARLMGYVINAGMSAFVYFCALAAWGAPVAPEDVSMASIGGIGDNIGLGQWRIEKQKYQAVMSAAYKKPPAVKKTQGVKIDHSGTPVEMRTHKVGDKSVGEAPMASPRHSQPSPGKVIDASKSPAASSSAAGPFSMDAYTRKETNLEGTPRTPHKSFMCC